MGTPGGVQCLYVAPGVQRDFVCGPGCPASQHPLPSPQPSGASGHLCPESPSCPEPLPPLPGQVFPWEEEIGRRVHFRPERPGVPEGCLCKVGVTVPSTCSELGVGGPEVLGGVQPPGDLCRSGPCRRPAASRAGAGPRGAPTLPTPAVHAGSSVLRAECRQPRGDTHLSGPGPGAERPTPPWLRCAGEAEGCHCPCGRCRETPRGAARP